MSEQQTKGYEKLIWRFASINLLLLLIEWLLLGDPTTIFGVAWNWGFTLFLAQALYVGMSLRSIGPTEFGVILFFGKPVYPVNSGLILVPWGLFDIFTVTKNIFQIVVGSVQTDREDRPVPVEKEQKDSIVLEDNTPYRVSYADLNDLDDATETEKKGGNPLHRTITTDTRIILTFKIRDVSCFLEHIGSLPQLMVIASQTVKGTLQRYAGENTLARVQLKIAHITSEISKSLEYRLGEKNSVPTGSEQMDDEDRPDCGVNIMSVQIPSLGIDHETNKSIRDRVKAALDADAAIRRSEGAAQAEKNMGEAQGFAEKQRLEGRAAGYAAMANATSGPDGQRVLATEALRDAVSNGNVTILPTDSGLLTGGVSLAAAITAASKNKPSNTNKT